VVGNFYKAVMMFPEAEVDEQSPLNHHKTGTRPPVFPAKVILQRNPQSGLYRAGYGRPVLVVEVAGSTAKVFVCSTKARDPANCSNTHRWIPVGGAPSLPTQPPVSVRIQPKGCLARRATYLCFTHAVQLTPVVQGDPVPFRSPRKCPSPRTHLEGGQSRSEHHSDVPIVFDSMRSG
jgi:hypothetical protein